MAREIELKLAFPPEALRAVLAHPLLASAARQGTTKTLINTYFDTPALTLSAQRVALRTRKSGEQWLQTVKCAAESFGGLSSRPEWEKPFTGQFDFSDIDASPVRKTLEKHRDALVPLFTTDFVRDTLSLSPREGVSILVMIDRGEISVDGRKEAISELELELVSGEADDLLALAGTLAGDLPLLPYDPSKAARGYQLFHARATAPQTSPLTSAHGETDALESFRQRALVCLAAWSANHHGALASEAPEFIHQLRVALTRLRALVRIFAPVLPDDFVSEWRQALQAEAAAFGPLRDLQILCEDLLPPAQDDDADGYLQPLAHEAAQRCASEREAARLRLAAAGAGLLQLRFHRALLALPNSPARDSGAILQNAIRHLHDQAVTQFAQACTDLRQDSLHALRILIRQLRLACELGLNVEQPRARKRLRALTRLQSELGRLNDLAQTMPAIGRWAGNSPELVPAAAFLSGWHAATSLKLRRTILRRASLVLAAPVQPHAAGAKRKKASRH